MSALTRGVRRAVKCTTEVSQAVPLIYRHIHSLRPTRAFAGEHAGRDIPSCVLRQL